MEPASAALEQDSVLAAVALALSSVLLAWVIQIKDTWRWQGWALPLGIALALCLLGVLRPRLRRFEAWIERWRLLLLLLGVGLAVQLALSLMNVPPSEFLRITLPDYRSVKIQDAEFRWYTLGLAAATLLVGAGLSERPWLGRARFPLVLLVFFLLGVWILHSSPFPPYDVYITQKDGLEALLSGSNPYAIRSRDIYAASPSLYGPGVSDGMHLTIGHFYPPLTLLLSIPGALIGDLRYSHLAAYLLSAAFIAYARPSRVAEAAAALYLFRPGTLHLLNNAYTEPFVVLFLSGVLFCACRAPRTVPFLLGGFLLSKQYAVLALPAFLLLLPRPLSRSSVMSLLAPAVAVATLIGLPFFLWGPSDFFRSVVEFQFRQPFRAASTSFMAWYFFKTRTLLPLAVPFGLAALALVLALWRCPRTPAGVAAAVALVFFVFFAFNKQAFPNYYSLVQGALCCAVALIPVRAATADEA